jgi:hypothetical protein
VQGAAATAAEVLRWARVEHDAHESIVHLGDPQLAVVRVDADRVGLMIRVDVAPEEPRAGVGAETGSVDVGRPQGVPLRDDLVDLVSVGHHVPVPAGGGRVDTKQRAAPDGATIESTRA